MYASPLHWVWFAVAVAHAGVGCSSCSDKHATEIRVERSALVRKIFKAVWRGGDGGVWIVWTA